MSEQQHGIAGRMAGASGVVTFCTCGLAFFATYDAPAETNDSRAAAIAVADARFGQHRESIDGR